jgi:hypothetical protein
MRISWLWDNAVTLATLVMAVTAIVALFYAHLQIAEGGKAQQQKNANELWRETLRLGFENPKLSDPSLKLADFDYEKLTIDRSRELFQQYEIYVDTLLNASDEILEISPNKALENFSSHSALAPSRLSAVAPLSEIRLSRTVRHKPPLILKGDFGRTLIGPRRGCSC